MKRAFAAAALLLFLAPAAFAQDHQRLEANEYLPGSRCVALANVRQLRDDGYNVDQLERLVRRYYSPVANAVANTQARSIRSEAGRAGDDSEKVADLRERRDATCAGFIANGLVQAPTGAVGAS